MLEDGLRIGHILDPRSGRPVVRRASVTVWHPDALAAQFECRLSPSRMARMLGEVQDAFDERADSVIVYRFKGGISEARIRFGRIGPHELGEPWVL